MLGVLAIAAVLCFVNFPISTPPVARQALPLLFEENVGQFDQAVRYKAKALGGTLLFTDDAIWLTETNCPKNNPNETSISDSKRNCKGVNLKLSFPGSNLANLVGQNKQETAVSYLIGNDPLKWHTNVPVFSNISYQGIYPGVDLVFSGEKGFFEPNVIAQNPQSLAAFRLVIEGAENMALKDENLKISTAIGELELPLFVSNIATSKPMVSGTEVASPFIFKQNYFSAVSLISNWLFPKASADTPGDLLYSTYLGGTTLGQADIGRGIAVDSTGAAYATGETGSTDFPTTPGAFDTTDEPGRDAFVTKINVDGTAWVYSTYLGGGSDDYGRSIAVDSSNNAFVVGYTLSNNFPTVPGSYDSSFNGTDDVFVIKLNSAGAGLLYGSYIGGSATDEGYSVAIDQAGQIYLTGYTASADFPTTTGAYDTSYNGSIDVIAVKLNPALSGVSDLVYSTFLGGSGGFVADYGKSVAVDGSGNIYLTGFTDATDFPTTTGAFDQIFNDGITGWDDAFVSKINPAGAGSSDLVYSTFLGGASDDEGSGIEVDSGGAAYIVGQTYSSDFPTELPEDNSLGGSSDIFVTKVNPSGGSLAYSTYLGGSGGDYCGYPYGGYHCGIAILASGVVYVTGSTGSSDFPVTFNAFDSTIGSGFANDVFLTKYNAAGSAILYSSYLGGSSDDFAGDVAIDSNGFAYLTGGTWSNTDFPISPGAPQNTALGGNQEAFITKLANAIPTPTPTSPPTDTPTSTSTSTSTSTNTSTPTLTQTPTITNTGVPTDTFTNTPTNTATNSPTRTLTITNTPLPGTSYPTNTPLPGETFTPPPTYTPYPTPTPFVFPTFPIWIYTPYPTYPAPVYPTIEFPTYPIQTPFVYPTIVFPTYPPQVIPTIIYIGGEIQPTPTNVIIVIPTKPPKPFALQLSTDAGRGTTVGGSVYQALLAGFAVGWSSIALYPIQLISLFFDILAGRRRKTWGTVYDSKNKKPLAQALVRIYDTEYNRLHETQVTTPTGSFGFIVPAGSYYLKCAKASYLFPSKQIGGKEDGFYQSVYHDETIAIEKEGSEIIVNIPGDPEVPTGGLILFWSQLKSFLRAVNLIVFIIVMVASVLTLIFDFTILQLVFFIIYLLLFGVVIWAETLKRRSFGRVYDKVTKQALPVAIVRLYDQATHKLLSTRVTSENGKFAFALKPGAYALSVTREGYVPSPEQTYKVTKAYPYIGMDIALEPLVQEMTNIK